MEEKKENMFEVASNNQTLLGKASRLMGSLEFTKCQKNLRKKVVFSGTP